MRDRPRVKTNSSAPRWALTESFADLFDPTLTATDLAAGIDQWTEKHLEPGELLRIKRARERGRQAHAVTVTLLDGTVRSLEPEEASHIVKGVIEQWVPARLADPVVLTISEPGREGLRRR